MSRKDTEVTVTEGCTNVYADLGYADAASLLDIDQSKISRITCGQFRGVSEAKLLELVAKLVRDVKIVVGPVRRRMGKIELEFA